MAEAPRRWINAGVREGVVTFTSITSTPSADSHSGLHDFALPICGAEEVLDASCVTPGARSWA